MGRCETQSLVEPVGVGTAGVRSQLHQLASALPGLLNRPADELGAESGASCRGSDPYTFDLGSGGASPGQPWQESQLQRADDRAIALGDNEKLTRVRGNRLEGALVRRQVIRRFPCRAQRILGQQRHDCRDIRRGRTADAAPCGFIHLGSLLPSSRREQGLGVARGHMADTDPVYSLRDPEVFLHSPQSTPKRFTARRRLR